MKAVTLTLWPALRRALIAYPSPITGGVFAPSGPVATPARIDTGNQKA